MGKGASLLRALIIITHIGMGGAERNAINLANSLSREGVCVRILTLVQKPVIYRLDPKLETVCCDVQVSHRSGALHFLTKAAQIPVCLKQICEQAEEFRPDVVISLLMPADLMVWLLRTVCPKKNIGKTCWIASERNDPVRRKRYIQYLLKQAYRKTDLLICQTERVQAFYADCGRSCVLPNVIDGMIMPEPGEEIRCGEKGDMLEFVSAGRFVPQKNFGLLIRAFAEACRQTDFKIHLTIYGDGQEREQILKAVRQTGMDGQISLPGAENNLFEKLSSAAGYIVSSDYEGISNALLEAVLMGLPVISTDWGTEGARKVIDVQSGILVPVGDEKAMTEAIVTLAENDELRRHMREHNRERRKKFDLENTTGKRWLETIRNAVAEHEGNGKRYAGV